MVEIVRLHCAATTSPSPSGDLDEIVYRISHDLRASVRALRELPEWLREDLQDLQLDLGEESTRTLALIQSHARRLDEMLNGLLAYSRVGRLQEVVTVQPQEIFENVLKDLAPGPEIRFYTQFNPVQVSAGAADLHKIFDILLTNAIRHNPAPDRDVEVTSCRSGDLWELMVSDNGPGIPPERRGEIFRPMVKLVSRDEDEGGGMGLAILRKIVDLHAGTVHVEDRRRKGGTTFRVRLPILA